ncbi:spermidine synthase [Gracilibacillus boraciitolerans JCM 21714]|uniref:Spermidine synthase n=1 Tax=Gracilibacillus boraciitolerans JCM 21714 TaxID=1298598 RepID=W4VHW1_9BACI|nr:spermidine synthase [Gracilibacillus boraciitolerans JCM 21714]
MDEIKRRQSHFIYWASGIVSICGIIFEVLFGALGSYILGDGVKQYTLTISLFLTGMGGIGASLSERVTKNLVLSFIYIEFFVALIGGFSSFLMFGATAFFSSGTDALFLYLITLTIGALTGVELPILIRKANEIGGDRRKKYGKGIVLRLRWRINRRTAFCFLTKTTIRDGQDSFFSRHS